MLLRHDVRVVHGLDTRLDDEVVPCVRLRVHILDADLVVSAVEGGEVVAVDE